jgi:hypothetical protein
MHLKKIKGFSMFLVALISTPLNHYSKYMSFTSWCQRAFIHCHPVESSDKERAMMQKANVSHGKTRAAVKRKGLPSVQR